MEIKIYIALGLLGINNSVLCQIINLVPKSELKNILNGNALEVQYRYSIDLSKYAVLLSDKVLINKRVNDAEIVISESKKMGVKILLINNSRYPEYLRKIDDPPAILYLKGKNITKSDQKSVACVGTRNPTEFGVKATKSIVSRLCNEGFSIISGLAYGIDRESHQACLNNNGRTIAVLAHGLDMIYPKEHSNLADEILRKGGTLISEYPIGVKADKFRFVERNRIVSGLSSGVIVFETKEKSGTMHTVDFAIKQKKKVFCPIPIRRELQSMGLYKLLNEKKAIGFKTKDDYDVIINELGYKVKKDKELMNRRKNTNLSRIISMNEYIFQDLIDITTDRRASFAVNTELFEKFKKILLENDITVKEFLYATILNTVERHGGKRKDE